MPWGSTRTKKDKMGLEQGNFLAPSEPYHRTHKLSKTTKFPKPAKRDSSDM